MDRIVRNYWWQTKNMKRIYDEQVGTNFALTRIKEGSMWFQKNEYF